MTADPLTLLVQQHLAGGGLRTEQLSQLLAQREEALRSELAEREAEEQARQEQELRVLERRAETDALHRAVEQMSGELEALREVLDEVAAALGACPGCWGQDPACRWCRGHGRPGFRPPDPDGFDRLVRPAVRTHALLHRRRPPPLPDPYAPPEPAPPAPQSPHTTQTRSAS